MAWLAPLDVLQRVLAHVSAQPKGSISIHPQTFDNKSMSLKHVYCLLFFSSFFFVSFSSCSSCSFSTSSSSGASVGKKDGKNDGSRSIYIHSSNIHFNYIMKLPNQLDPASQVSPFFGFDFFFPFFLFMVGICINIAVSLFFVCYWPPAASCRGFAYLDGPVAE